MNGVTFGNKHSYDDFGLILTSKTISPPKPKLRTIEVPGAAGDIDLTEVLTGVVDYENRKLSFAFAVPDISNWADATSELMAYLHGKKMEIILDTDPDWYYEGRITVNEYGTQKGLGTVVIDCDCYPYKISTGSSTVLSGETGNDGNFVYYITQTKKRTVRATVYSEAAGSLTLNYPENSGTTYTGRLNVGSNGPFIMYLNRIGSFPILAVLPAGANHYQVEITYKEIRL